MEKRVEFYEKNLDRVNYWLQFAETKNAAAIAFIVAMLAVVYTSNLIDNLVLVILITAVYVVSLIIAILSLYPQYKKDVKSSDGTYKNTDNLLFWNDIAKYSVDDYIDKVTKNFFKNNNAIISALELSFVEEIITNARIAKFKYNMFRTSVGFSILGTVLIPIFLIIIA